MKKNTSAVVGIVCGLACMLSVGGYVAQVENDARAAHEEMLARYGGEQLEVCVAKRDIAPGEVIDSSAVEVRTWVSALLPEGSITDIEAALGQKTSSSVLKGEVITTKRLGVEEVQVDVPAGLSAVSVPAQDVQAVGGALACGMRADVYAVSTSTTACIVEGALVVATSAHESSGLSGSSSWITLAVPPNAVQEVVTAAQNLQLYFVLPSDAVLGDEGRGDSPASQPVA